eukprot:2899779-Prymnesium_polylepis.1
MAARSCSRSRDSPMAERPFGYRSRAGRPPACPGARVGRTGAPAPGPAPTPRTTRRHSNQRRDTGAD